MKDALARRLFGPVMFWTGLTTIFAWLPLVRIIARPEGYTWGLPGVSGAGTDGPYWIFVLSTIYVVTLLFSAFRGPRALFYPMLIAWHLTVTGVVVAGVARGGSGAMLQGQGLHFAVPLWLLVVPFALSAAIAVIWVISDYRSDGAPRPAPWSRANTRALAVSLGLLAVALVLFRAGTNYDWVTAAAIVTTIAHWILLIQSFAPVDLSVTQTSTGLAGGPPLPEDR